MLPSARRSVTVMEGVSPDLGYAKPYTAVEDGAADSNTLSVKPAENRMAAVELLTVKQTENNSRSRRKDKVEDNGIGY